MIILDDKPEVWGSHYKNLFYTKPFIYWYDLLYEQQLNQYRQQQLLNTKNNEN